MRRESRRSRSRRGAESAVELVRPGRIIRVRIRPVSPPPQKAACLRANQTTKCRPMRRPNRTLLRSTQSSEPATSSSTCQRTEAGGSGPFMTGPVNRAWIYRTGGARGIIGVPLGWTSFSTQTQRAKALSVKIVNSSAGITPISVLPSFVSRETTYRTGQLRVTSYFADTLAVREHSSQFRSLHQSSEPQQSRRAALLARIAIGLEESASSCCKH